MAVSAPNLTAPVSVSLGKGTEGKEEPQRRQEQKLPWKFLFGSSQHLRALVQTEGLQQHLEGSSGCPELLAGERCWGAGGQSCPQNSSGALLGLSQGAETQPWMRPQLRTSSFCHGASPGQSCHHSALLCPSLGGPGGAGEEEEHTGHPKVPAGPCVGWAQQVWGCWI